MCDKLCWKIEIVNDCDFACDSQWANAAQLTCGKCRELELNIMEKRSLNKDKQEYQEL